MTIRFNENDVRAMGRTAGGVRGMKLKNADDAVVSVDVARDDTAILVMTEAGYGKRTQLDKFNVQGRGGQGVRGIKLTGKKGASSRPSWSASTMKSWRCPRVGSRSAWRSVRSPRRAATRPVSAS